MEEEKISQYTKKALIIIEKKEIKYKNTFNEDLYQKYVKNSYNLVIQRKTLISVQFSRSVMSDSL